MNIIEPLKIAAEILRKADKIPEYQTILDSMEKVIELREENANLKEENRNFKLLDKFEKSLIYEKNAYYSVDKKGVKEGPYCPVCWGGDNKKIRMRENDRIFYCDRCKAFASK